MAIYSNNSDVVTSHCLATSPECPLCNDVLEDTITMALHIKQRLQDVVDNIQQPETLLKSFEDTLGFEDDLWRWMRYEQDIQPISSSTAGCAP